ncbi:XRE family transcriptional regulator [Pseudonocardia sp. H11422]|uniref:XRE family transcriptional regulator n=1 Tax=Pseudonocardia sp. H11422 TaxID=2835866 RepID=UPI001BDD2ABE|nr:XRE family transcriptional regulator [Pseudonocardia sp. H11422]
MSANEQLSALLREAGFLDRDGSVGRKRFARAVTAMAARRGLTREYTHTYVSRWINGTVPRDAETRACILQALGERLGREVHPDEVGFAGASISPDVGLTYPDGVAESASTLATLLQADLDQAGSVVASPVSPAAWSDASLSWLVGARSSSDDWPGTVGASDVERIRQTRLTFAMLDNRFGGGHTRRALVSYLRDDLPRTLRATASSSVQQQLFAASAEITQLAAWSSYDVGHHGLAQRYFIQALALADAADDRSLAASILDAMSHQATYLGRFREAANLARAAHLGTTSLGIPVLSAHFRVMEARALARLGDATGCDAALSEATTQFERHSTGDGPEWIQYFDEAEFAAELGHCHRDLGRPSAAIGWATRAVDGATGDYLRSDFFATMLLAQAQLDAGEVESGCETALCALDLGEELQSTRCASYVGELRRRLPRFRGSRVLADFVEQARTRRLWVQADQ